MATVVKTTYEPTRKVTETKYKYSRTTLSKTSNQPIQKLNPESKLTLKKIIELTRIDIHKSVKQSQVTVNYYNKVDISLKSWISLINDCKNVGICDPSINHRLDLKWFTLKSKMDKMSIVIKYRTFDSVICEVFYYQGRITVE